MTRFQTFLATAATLALTITLPAARAAANELDIKVDTATEILQDLQRIPESGVPPSLLERAYAIAVIPSVVKASFLGGISYGKGILVVRRADGQWSNPSFVQFYGGSFGFQAGLQSTDMLLVFKTQRALDGISGGKITFGGNASVAAGPVGREAAAATDVQMQSEIYTYARTRGLFAGVSAQGAWMRIDEKANSAYYEGTQASASKILTDTTIPSPASARRFIDTLATATPPLENAPAARAASRDAPAPDAEMEAAPPSGTHTYGTDGAPGTAPPAGTGKF